MLASELQAGLSRETPDKAAARTRLFEAVARLGQALAARVPVVLFLDDVQWVDAASLDVVHYAVHRWAESRSPILLLLSLRSEALITAPALADWLSGLRHDLPLRRVAHMVQASMPMLSKLTAAELCADCALAGD